MPLVNHARQELHLKVVYYGPGLGGKTTNLEQIHGRTRPERRGKLISLATEAERTLFFDLLPVELGTFKGYQVRLHLCTVPGQIAHDRTRRLVLRHVDGIVFVADSQSWRVDDNRESIANLADNLRLQGDDPHRLPIVVQYNKRDLPEVMSPDELRAALGIPDEVAALEAVASRGVGVFETVKEILKACLKIVGDPRSAREGRSPSIIPGMRPSMFPMAPGEGPEEEPAADTADAAEEAPTSPFAPFASPFAQGHAAGGIHEDAHSSVHGRAPESEHDETRDDARDDADTDAPPDQRPTPQRPEAIEKAIAGGMRLPGPARTPRFDDDD